jgi:hypothetical protein
MKTVIVSMICVLFHFHCAAEISGEAKAGLFAPYISKETAETLVQQGEISTVIKKGENLNLLPAVSKKKEIEEEIKEMDPLIGVEILILHSSMKKNIHEAEEYKLLLYNTLRSISTLKGIQYYSASRKRMRIFYHDAYVIDSPKTKKRMQDPLVDTIIETDRIYAFFKDSSFGDYTCGIDYAVDDECYFMKMENLTLIWYIIFPIIDPRNLRSYIIIIPAENHLLFYGYSCLDSTNLFGIAESRIESLYNRIKAIYNWFDRQFEGEQKE